jgi:hypothetical protein
MKHRQNILLSNVKNLDLAKVIAYEFLKGCGLDRNVVNLEVRSRRNGVAVVSQIDSRFLTAERGGIVSSLAFHGSEWLELGLNNDVHYLVRHLAGVKIPLGKVSISGSLKEEKAMWCIYDNVQDNALRCLANKDWMKSSRLEAERVVLLRHNKAPEKGKVNAL